VGALAVVGREVILKLSGERIVMRLRSSLFKQIMSQDMSFFDKNRTGEWMNRLSSDSSIVGKMLTDNLSSGLRSIVMTVAGVGTMFYMSPQLTVTHHFH
jgi:ABC-type multidrug transport system fused ATPase/permease subunit